MNRYFTYTTILLMLFLVKNITAQDNCVLKLNEAEKLFEKGRIEEIPKLLSGCIKSGFNSENKTSALRLLTLVYLSEDNTSKAEKTLLELLSHNPEYKINKTVDPSEFIQLFNSFNTAPVFSIGLVLGPTITTPHLIETFSKNSVYEANPEYSSGGIGFSIGLKGIYHINNILDISTEPIFSYLTYDIKENVTQPNTATITETINYLEFPVFGSYYFYKKNSLKFYGEMGLSYNMLLSGSLNGIVTYNNSELEPPAINTKNIRKNYNLIGIVGVGTKISLNRSNIQASIRYKAGLMNIVDTEMRYSDHEGLNSNYLFIDNDIFLNNFTLMISYNWEFYIHNKKPNNQTNYDAIK